MKTLLVKCSSFLAMSIAVGVGFAVSCPEAVVPSNVVGGFCANAKCKSTFNAKCSQIEGSKDTCPATANHDECSSGDENDTMTCTVSGANCDTNKGCQAHDNCTCS